MTIKTEQGFRGYWTAYKGNKVVARHNSLTLLEQELKAQGFTEHRVKFYKGGERVYKL
jgi:hypothetical protein